MNERSICNDCGYRVERLPAEGACGNWLAEDDTYGCAGRGDPFAEPAEVLPHRPIYVQVDAFPTFKPVRYPITEFAR